MNDYYCHCTVEMHDEGLGSKTKARPNKRVKANSKSEARNKAKSKLRKEYSGPKNKATAVYVELVKEV